MIHRGNCRLESCLKLNDSSVHGDEIPATVCVVNCGGRGYDPCRGNTECHEAFSPTLIIFASCIGMAVVQIKVSQLADALPLNFVQTLIVSRG